MSGAVAVGTLTELPAISARQIKKLKKDPALTAAAAGLHYISGSDAPGIFAKENRPGFIMRKNQVSAVKTKRLLPE